MNRSESTSNRKASRRSTLAALALAAAGVGLPAVAQATQYDNAPTAHLTSPWSTLGIWTVGGSPATDYPRLAGDIANFTTNFDRILTIDQNISLGQMLFNGNGKLDLPLGAGTLTWDSGTVGTPAVWTINNLYGGTATAPMVLNSNLEFNYRTTPNLADSREYTITSPISGVGSFTILSGNSIRHRNAVVINAVNSYSGTTTINGGAVVVNAGKTLGTGNIYLNAATNTAWDPTKLIIPLTALGATQTITANSDANGLVAVAAVTNPTSVSDLHLTGANGGVYGINYTGTSGITSMAAMDTALGATGSAHWFIGSVGNWRQDNNSNEFATNTPGTFDGATLAPASDNIYRLGGGGGKITFSNLVMDATASVEIGSTLAGGAGWVVIGQDQTYAGTTTVAAGSTVQIGNGGTTGSFGAGAVTLNGGLAINRSNAFAIPTVNTTTGSLFQIGSGTSTVSAASNQFAGVTIGGGTLAVSDAASSLNVASGELGIRGNTSVLSMSAGSISVANRVRFGNDGSVGIARISGGNINQTASYVDMGFNGGRGLLEISGTGSYTGGRELRMGEAYEGNNQVFLTDNASATFGAINMSHANAVAGANNFSLIEVSGTASLTGSSMVVGRSTSNATAYAAAQFNQKGGTTTINGTVGIANTQTSGTLQGVINLSGGELKVQKITSGTGTARLNFHGGTLGYSGTTAQTDFVALNATNGAAYIYEGGTINTNGQDVTIAAALRTPNVSSGVSDVQITAGGTGYTVAPGVKIVGDGVGATAVANVSGGVVTGVTITNPGTGYTVPPTVTLLRGTGTGVTVGTVGLTTNAYSGGLTKVGAGKLTLTGANTYTGPTTVNGGILAFGGDQSITSGVTVNNGGKLEALAGTLSLKTLTLGAAGTDALGLNLANASTFVNVINPSGLNIVGDTSFNFLDNSGLSVGSTYTLLDYDTAFLGSLSKLHLGGAFMGTIFNDPASTAIKVTLTAVGDPRYVWDGNDGTANNDNWDNAAATFVSNFVHQSNADGQEVVFNDTLHGTGNVNLSAYASPKSVLIDNATKSYNLTGTGLLSGTMSLTKQNTGTFTLGNSGMNSYTGGTNITAGTLKLGLPNVLPQNGKVTVTGGTLDLGTNSQTLTGDNNLSLQGGTVANGSLYFDLAFGGTLAAGWAGTLIDLQSGVISADITGYGAGLKTTAGTVTLSGNNVLGSAYQNQKSGLRVNAGKLIITGNTTVADSNNGSISGGATLEVSGNGTLTSGGHDWIIGGAGSSVVLKDNGVWTLRGSGVYAVANATGDINDSLTIQDNATFTVDRTVGGTGAWTTGGLVVGMGWGGTQSGVVNQNGGTVNLPQFANWNYDNGPGLILGGIITGNTVTATYNLNGGTLNVSAIMNLAGTTSGGTVPWHLDISSAPGQTAIFNFNGGTLKPTQSDSTEANAVLEGSNHLMTNLSHAYVQAGGAKIDTNSFDASINQSLEHDPALGASADGGLTKKGAGTLTLLKANSYTGDTKIEGGALKLIAPAVAQANTILAANDVTLQVQDSTAIGAISPATITNVWTLVRSGYNGGSGPWTGNGITTTAVTNSSLNGLGLVLSGDPALEAQTLTVREMILGDVNGDNKVTIGDVMVALNSANYQQDGTWLNGDVNYDGKVTIGDVMLMLNSTRYQQDYNPANAPAQIAALEAAGLGSLASAAVPEPATLGLLAVGAMGFLARRRRA